MIKLVLRRDGHSDQKLLLVGLNDLDLARLVREKKPIGFDGAEVGLPGVDIAICYADTLDALTEGLRAVGLDVPTAEEIEATEQAEREAAKAT